MPGAIIRAGIVGGYDPHEEPWHASMNANLAAIAARTDPTADPMPAAPLWAHHFDGADEIGALWTDANAAAFSVTKSYVNSRLLLACPAGDGLTTQIGGWRRAMSPAQDLRVRWHMVSNTYLDNRYGGLWIGFQCLTGPFPGWIAGLHQRQNTGVTRQWDQSWLPAVASATSIGGAVANTTELMAYREAWFQMRWNGTTKMVAWDWSPSGHRYVKGLEVTADSLFGAGNFSADAVFLGVNKRWPDPMEYELDWIVAEQTYNLND